jgi:DNA-binding NtrC family response regulator
MANLLVVDDDRDIGDTLADVLSALGHQVRVGRHGREGLDLVQERVPDLVLLDVEMPVLTGPDMAWLLFLRNCGDEKIPIVLTSGVVGLDRVAEVVGTPYFLSKPYEVPAVVDLVERALQQRIPPNPRRHT